MKKIAIILFALFIIANNGFTQDKKDAPKETPKDAPKDAQTKKDKKIQIGLQGVASIGWFKPDANSKTITSNGVKLNLGYGFIFDYKFSQNVSFLTGFNVAYNGGKLQMTYDTLPSKFKPANSNTIYTKLIGQKNYGLQYIDIPLMIKMSTNEIGYLTYFLNIGASVGFNLKANGNYTYTEVGTGDEIKELKKDTEDVKTDIKLFRAMFIVGAGAKYSLGGNASVIGSINFNNGLTNILKNEKGQAINNYISVNVGIIF